MSRLDLAVPGTALLMAAALIVFGACNGGDSAPASPSPTGAPPFEGSRGPVEKEVPDPEIAFLADVRTAQQGGFDRVTFEFEDGSTGYRIEYVQPPITEDPSGRPIDIEGSALLRVVFFSATGVDLSGETPRVTCCASEVTTGLPSLIDLQQTGDFEATLSWVLGLREEVDFRVSELEDPYRIVIDVAHP